ncbi:P-type ATPase [Clostridium psychrophilum]|uniref:P-type ATPase n=1 Tax=Clostridium psychrophilum TaxID=132926 RepID=UPI001C0CC2EE|nr:cation-transporting P-type ATPase [Clostridium psychrophilum]MBU3182566.1 hypothetical protein [Clostridium psychrophilum]
MKKWYSETATRVAEILNSDIYLGLTENKIKYMRQNNGKNIILVPEVESISKLTISEIKQWWILVNLLFIGMMIYNEMNIIAYIVAVIMMGSVILLINGDYKEEKSLMVLDNLNTGFSQVMRCGKVYKIECEEIVVGDIVYLKKGNHVPADIRILECENLKVVEGTVTDEKYEAEKYSMKMEGEVMNLSEIKNIVYKSSIVTKGSGLGIVIATGMDTQIGKIIKELFNYKNDNKIFSRGITKIINNIAIITIIAGIITLAFTIYRKFSIHEIINALIYIFMTFNFPIIIIMLYLLFYIVFAEFKKKNVYINDNSAIYFLSNISTIFTKKIGAISENKLVLREIYCDSELIYVQYQGVEIEGNVERIISIALLCNDAKQNDEKTTLYIENPNSIEDLAEKAIVKYFNDKLIKKSELERKHERIFEIPYNSNKRIKTVVNRFENRYRANVYGLLDSVFDKCTHILINGVEKEINEIDIKNVIGIHINMSSKVYNVIAYGYRNFNYEPSIDENIESNLVFVGLMGFENPIKKSSYEAMQTCKEINIRPIIEEEDNKLASFAFGKSIGLTYKKEEILSGTEIDYMSNKELSENIESISIFSKIRPKHKSKIVNSLNYNGFCVASVGDTLKDLEYLNNSNIAISVGSGCSTVVRELSSLFLQENDLSKIIDLVQHSKKIVNYINIFVLFLCSAGVSEIFMILISLITNGNMPFSFLGAIYINFVIVPCCGSFILFQSRIIDKNLKNINCKYIEKASIKSSFIIMCIYIFIYTIINKYTIVQFQNINLAIFVIYQTIFSLTFLYEKRMIKNKISYMLFAMNLLLQTIFILYFWIFK